VTATVRAIYEGGVLKPQTPLALPEKTSVLVTIQSEPLLENDTERRAWLQLSEESLMKSWSNARMTMSSMRILIQDTNDTSVPMRTI
jgi:predicted DNA-binding antitoxin AbrB/MazE fold protein